MTGSRTISRVLAPAKVNLGLEVLSKRNDGYHEIRTLMQAVSVFDRITMIAPGSGIVTSTSPQLSPESNLMSIAAQRLASRFDRELDVDFTLTKRIAIAAGLGGGSSDAAAVIRLLCHCWRIDVHDSAVLGVAESIGSDIPFFLYGGRALATGRGEQIQPSPLSKPFWVVIVVPDLQLESKTANLYSLLGPDDFTDGSRVQPAGEHIVSFHNAFGRPLYEQYPEIEAVGDALRAITDQPVVLSGAGPSHYVLFEHLVGATTFLRTVASQSQLKHCRCLLARTLRRQTPFDETRNPVG